LLDILERYKNVVLAHNQKLEQFLEENGANSDLIDFIDFLICEDIIQPNSSVESGKGDNDKNSWCNHPELIDQITTFFNTGVLPDGEVSNDLSALYAQILAIITEGPLQTRFKEAHLPNFSAILENIKRYQRALVNKIGDKIHHLSSVLPDAVKHPQEAITSAGKEAQMFSTTMAFFYLWEEKPHDKSLENDFIKFANMYYCKYSSHFEKVRMYLHEKIEPVVAAKLNTSDVKKIIKETDRIEKKITKRGWWQFWK